MKDRPKGATDLLPEDMEALGLTPDRVMEIVLGPGRAIPPPPEGGDPRAGMDLDTAQRFVAPGEFIRIFFDRSAGQASGEIAVIERYVLKFPSGFSTDEIDEGDAGRVLLSIGYDYSQMRNIVKKSQTYRNTVLWPHEGVHLAVIKTSEGKEYYS